MKIKSVLISDIKVSDRRREDFGDIQGLADSIARFGLFHPIVVDEADSLIAGERRLRACTQLGWTEIPARPYRDLTDNEKRGIELEENVRRKDLTTYEASKQLKRQGEKVAELISGTITENKKGETRGRKPTHAAPKEDIAKALGVSEKTFRNAEQHVAAVEKYPELSIIPTQKDVLTVAKNLDALPEDERTAARSKLMKHDQGTLAVLAEKPPMPPARARQRSAGDKWRDGLSQIRVFISSIKAIGGGEELTGAWSDIERRSFLTELCEFRDDVNSLISELEEAENGFKQRAG